MRVFQLEGASFCAVPDDDPVRPKLPPEKWEQLSPTSLGRRLQVLFNEWRVRLVNQGSIEPGEELFTAQPVGRDKDDVLRLAGLKQSRGTWRA